ncbi:MAG: FprA family A-type flavoprotein [Candidatus Zophobacter franzmannii]|nr:FprA family A-type flavoprotein [Candidatus Zophobacter franzmannii]
MDARRITDKVSLLGYVDWDARLFDSLIPLPDGTSYNSFLIKGSEKNVIIDSVEAEYSAELLSQLDDDLKLDYIISLHAEQDHSGSIPMLIEKYPGAKVITNPKGKELLISLLNIKEDKFITVEDGEELSLGDKTLEFIYTPWVHWPETMSAYLKEDKILFSCDFFGSHIATTDLYVTDEGRVYEAAKRYFAEIMMPFNKIIIKNIAKILTKEISIIAPSHGPLYPKPSFIIDAYKDWLESPAKNMVVLPYISMHGSTKLMVDYLVTSLVKKGVAVQLYNLAVTDIGKLAIDLVDAGTIVIGTPTVLSGPHPNVAYGAFLANALRPKAKFISIVGSYGWGGKAVEVLAGMLPNLKVEIIAPVLAKGVPLKSDFEALDILAEEIAKKHIEQGFL